ncbi:hypothetical protein [Rhodococcoides kroppenstedtii]|uniref:hypothetical protein n=1 Tax=Rhodococcoides kroppenstedtii TaxID=293050 RepID=UPI0021C07462|nr:hypothetical protein [Rhodococcus kroppenstedtii]
MTGAAPAGDDIADRVAAAVIAVPGVAFLHGGVFGEIGTYLPGRRVAGVAVRDDATEVHIAVTTDAVVRDTADAVRRAVRAVVDKPVNVLVEDVVPADAPQAGSDPSESSAPGGGTPAP